MRYSRDVAEELRLDYRNGILTVGYVGQLQSVDEARSMQTAIEAACEEHSTRYVIFDNRSTVAPNEEIRGSMFRWALGWCTRGALVLHSELAAIRMNMDVLAAGGRLRAFGAVAEAEQWLRKGMPK